MRFIIIFLLLFGLTVKANSQFLVSPQVVATSGDYSEINNGIKVSWTIGEVITETFINGKVSVTQGFLQESYDIDIPPEGINEKEYFTNLKVYPNPVVSFVKLSLEIKEKQNLKLYLFDSEGKKLLIQPLNSGENTVYLPQNSTNFFLVSIQNPKNENLKTFKLVKK